MGGGAFTRPKRQGAKKYYPNSESLKKIPLDPPLIKGEEKVLPFSKAARHELAECGRQRPARHCSRAGEAGGGFSRDFCSELFSLLLGQHMGHTSQKNLSGLSQGL
jgi:hypothetical protein